MTFNEDPDDKLETVDEEELIALLNEKGLADPSTQELLKRWTDLAETEANQVARGPQAEINRAELEIRRATLYSRGNLGDIAYEAWDLANEAVKATNSPALIARLQREAGVFGYSF